MEKNTTLEIVPFCPHCGVDVDKNRSEQTEIFQVRMGVCQHCNKPFEWRKFNLENRDVLWPRRIDESFCTLSGARLAHRSPFDWTEFGGSPLRNFSPHDEKSAVFEKIDNKASTIWDWKRGDDRSNRNDLYDWSAVLKLGLEQVSIGGRQATVSSVCLYRGDIYIGTSNGFVARIPKAYSRETAPSTEELNTESQVYQNSRSGEFEHKHIAMVNDVICSAGNSLRTKKDMCVYFWDLCSEKFQHRDFPDHQILRHPSTIGTDSYAFTVHVRNLNDRKTYMMVFSSHTCLEENYHPLKIDISDAIADPINVDNEMWYPTMHGVRKIFFSTDFQKIVLQKDIRYQKNIREKIAQEIPSMLIRSQTVGENHMGRGYSIHSVVGTGTHFWGMSVHINDQQNSADITISPIDIKRPNTGDLRSISLSAWSIPSVIDTNPISYRYVVSSKDGIYGFRSFEGERISLVDEQSILDPVPPIMGAFGMLYYDSALVLNQRNWFRSTAKIEPAVSTIKQSPLPTKEAAHMVMCGRAVFYVDEVSSEQGKDIAVWKFTLERVQRSRS